MVCREGFSHAEMDSSAQSRTTHVSRWSTAHQHCTPDLADANRLVHLNGRCDTWSRRATRGHVPARTNRVPSHLPGFHVARCFDSVVWAGAAKTSWGSDRIEGILLGQARHIDTVRGAKLFGEVEPSLDEIDGNDRLDVVVCRAQDSRHADRAQTEDCDA